MLSQNLRNILKANVEKEVHEKVIKMIINPHLIENAKMFPLQYFSAI